MSDPAPFYCPHCRNYVGADYPHEPEDCIEALRAHLDLVLARLDRLEARIDDYEEPT